MRFHRGLRDRMIDENAITPNCREGPEKVIEHI